MKLTGLLASALVLGATPVVNAQLAQSPAMCRPGYVLREAYPGDRVCVDSQTHDQVASDNAQAGTRREPNGGASGPDTCRPGYVWREARQGDHVCVTPAVRAQTAEDNQYAIARRVRAGHRTANDNGAGTRAGGSPAPRAD